MLTDKFVYKDFWQAHCQSYMVIHDWVRLGEFNRINFNIKSEAIDRLNELMADNMPVFRNEDQFDLLVNFAIGSPDYRDMLEKVDPSYRAFTGDRGFFVFSYTKLLLRDTLHGYFEEFRELWREQKKKDNAYRRDKVFLYSPMDLKRQIYTWICDWIIDEDIDDIVSYPDILMNDRLESIINKNRELYLDPMLLNPLMSFIVLDNPYFSHPSSFRLPAMDKPDDIPEALKRIWVALFREVLIENFAEFKGMRTLRRRMNDRV